MHCHKIKKRDFLKDIVVIFLTCIFYVLAVNYILDEYYYVYVTPIILYEKGFSFVKMLICMCLAVITYYSACNINEVNGISYYFMRIMYVVYCFPMIMSYCLFDHNKSFEFVIASFLYWEFLCSCCKYIIFDLKNVKVNFSIDRLVKILLPLSIFVIIIYIISILQNFHLSLSLQDVYEIRQDFKDNSNIFITILKTALGIFICPCLFVYYMLRKKKVQVFLMSFIQIILFSFAKDKMYLMLLLVSVIVGFIGKQLYINFDKYIRLGLMAMAGIMVTALAGIAQNTLFNIFLRRFLVIPSWLNYLFFEFFYDKPKVWWHQDVFLVDKFFTPRYEDSIIQLIGKEYFKGTVASPNAGMLAEAFSHCGWLGIIIYPIFIAFLLNIFNYFLKNANKGVQIMFSFSLVMVLSNDSITSTSFVLTMAIVVFYSIIFYERKGYRDEKARNIGN